MLDVSVSYNRYKFIGYEFITWLWYVTKKDRKLILDIDKDINSFDVGKRIVLENRIQDNVETVTIKGDDPGLEEGMLSLRKGAYLTEMNIVFKTGENNYSFTIKGESFNICNISLPDTGQIESEDEIEGLILGKVYMTEKIFNIVDGLYEKFIKLRVSNDWVGKTLPDMKKWISS